MRRDVPPIVGVALILVALGAVQLVYWRALVTEDRATLRGGGGGGGAEVELTRGLPGVIVETVAGEGEPGWRDGVGSNALFDGPAAVATGFDGAVYVADSRNHVIRMVSPEGRVSTIAGSPGEPGYVDGPRGEARFFAPAGVAVGWDGSLFVADTGNQRIRRISRGGMVSTFAGAATPTDEIGRAVGGHRDGGAGEAQFRYPVGLAVSGDGSVYVADAGNRCLRRISPGGEVTTLAVAGEGALQSPTGVCLTSDGRVWVADTGGHRLWSGPREGPLRPWEGEAGDAGQGFAPAGMAALRDASGEERVYVSDSVGGGLWRIQAAGLRLMAGRLGADSPFQDGRGDLAAFSQPAGIASGGERELYVADFGNQRIRRVTLSPAAKERD